MADDEVRLPDFVPPMLARSGAPFDSDRHLFELKWDGMRTLAFVAPHVPGGYRLANRQERDVTDRYPEFESMGRMPPGLILDGELVALVDGKPNFSRLMSRQQTRDSASLPRRMRDVPVTYVVFDLLYVQYAPIVARPLTERRELLQELLVGMGNSGLLFSEAVSGGNGAGLTLFEHAQAQELEGVMAKRLDSTYQPGRRGDAWTKIKKAQQMHCLVLGYTPAEDGRGKDFGSLIVAGPDDDGELVCVGRVGSGLSTALRADLLARMTASERRTPLIPCKEKGRWIEPGLYCTVSFLERTKTGSLRAPVLLAVVE